jgi:hypothetical protein
LKLAKGILGPARLNTYAAYHVLYGGVDPMGLRGADPKYWAERGEREKERARRDEERKRREGTGERNFFKIFWDEYFLSKYEEDKQANLDSGRGMNEFCAGTLAFLDTAPVFSTGSRGAEALHGERLQGVDYGEPLSGTERGLEGGEFVLSLAGPVGRLLGPVDEVVDVTSTVTKTDGVVTGGTDDCLEMAKLQARRFQAGSGNMSGLPDIMGPSYWPDDLGKILGKAPKPVAGFDNTEDAKAAAKKILEDAGPGSQVLVRRRANEGGIDHVFNGASGPDGGVDFFDSSNLGTGWNTDGSSWEIYLIPGPG